MSRHDDTPNDILPRVRVHSRCVRASCLQGIFPCDEPMAGHVVTVRTKVLRHLDRERQEFWTERWATLARR